MTFADVTDRLKRFEIPGRVSLLEGNGGLPKIEVTTDYSEAEIYLHGGQVTHFQKKGDAPLLFLSQVSRFASGQAIRGGIPIIFPWFGAREGEPMHGFARLTEWECHEATAVPEGGVSLRFSLPNSADGATWPLFTANYIVTITDALALELIITNASPDQPFSFETCLHTYFFVGDINAVSVSGLKGATYLDKVEHFAQKSETNDALKITSELDRIYLDMPGPIEIRDEHLRRKIRIHTTGAASTVVWNPWSVKAQQMPDFGNDEYKQMICVESGNVAKNKVMLPPGHSAVLQVKLSSAPL